LKNRGPGENLGRGTLLKTTTDPDFERFWKWFGYQYGYQQELKEFLWALWQALKNHVGCEALALRCRQTPDPGAKDREPDHSEPEQGLD
jgi:hypothetical protein